jgi:hypothetical protein
MLLMHVLLKYREKMHQADNPFPQLHTLSLTYFPPAPREALKPSVGSAFLYLWTIS